jgi:hypothetical protein
MIEGWYMVNLCTTTEAKKKKEYKLFSKFLYYNEAKKKREYNSTNMVSRSIFDDAEQTKREQFN